MKSQISNLKSQNLGKGLVPQNYFAGLAPRRSFAGFTLIEIVVAIAVFSVASVVGIGALLGMIDAQQKVLALRVAQDNLTYAMDTMSKEIRTGTRFHCDNAISTTLPLIARDCPGDTVFSFLNSDGRQVNYRVNNGQLERSTSTGATIDFVLLTSPDLVVINSLLFYVRGAGTPLDGIQPAVTIVLRGTAGKREKIKASLNLQTTVSQRSLDE